MQVVDHGVFLAAAAQFAFVEVVEKFTFYAVHAQPELAREVEYKQHCHSGYGYHAGAGGVGYGDCACHEEERYQESEDSHYYAWHIASGGFFACGGLGLHGHDKSQDEWCHNHEGGEHAQQLAPPSGKLREVGQQVTLRYYEYCQQHYRVQHCAPDVALHHFFPRSAGGFATVGLLLIAVDKEVEAARQVSLENAVERQRHLDEVGRGEGGDYRYRHDDGVDGGVEHAEAHAECGYDECKFTYLGKRETRLNGCAQGLAGDEHSECSEHYHSHDYHCGQNQYRPPVVDEYRWLHHHAYRDEKHGSEEVFDRGDDVLYALGVGRSGKYGTHNERSQGEREAAVYREYGHAEAQPHRHYQQCFGVEETAYAVEQRRQHVHSHQKPYYEEEHKLAYAVEEFAAFNAVVDGYRRKQHHHKHGEEVFHNEHGQNEGGELFLPQTHVGKCLDDDGCRRHREHSAEKEAVDIVEIEQMAYGEARAHHSCDYYQCCHHG